MKLTLAILAVAVLLASCKEKAQAPTDVDVIHAEIKKILKDPDSARFGTPIFYEDQVCVEYNAKNGFGGYGAPSFARLKKSTYGWFLENPKAPLCNETYLQTSVEDDKNSKQAFDALLKEQK